MSLGNFTGIKPETCLKEFANFRRTQQITRTQGWDLCPVRNWRTFGINFFFFFFPCLAKICLGHSIIRREKKSEVYILIQMNVLFFLNLSLSTLLRYINIHVYNIYYIATFIEIIIYSQNLSPSVQPLHFPFSNTFTFLHCKLKELHPDLNRTLPFRSQQNHDH